jgi:UTP--glucose-1-phosphate uridylyltransferase
VKAISKLANIYYIRQKELLGIGRAVLCAKSFIGNDSFAMLLGDNIICSDKPSLKEASSQLAIIGRHILIPEIFPNLEKLPIGAGREYQLTDAINIYNQPHPVYAKLFQGKRYDIGDKRSFIKATIDFALQRPDLKE